MKGQRASWKSSAASALIVSRTRRQGSAASRVCPVFSRVFFCCFNAGTSSQSQCRSFRLTHSLTHSLARSLAQAGGLAASLRRDGHHPRRPCCRVSAREGAPGASRERPLCPPLPSAPLRSRERAQQFIRKIHARGARCQARGKEMGQTRLPRANISIHQWECFRSLSNLARFKKMKKMHDNASFTFKFLLKIFEGQGAGPAWGRWDAQRHRLGVGRASVVL